MSDALARVNADGSALTIPRDYLIDRQGKTFALYAGLLDLAHRRYPGRFSIKTTLLHLNAAESFAVVQATVEVKGDDGQVAAVFEGLGDVTTKNVGGNVRDHWLRMAETRAKARALRDMLNVAEAVDEADEESERPRQAPRQQQAAAQPRLAQKAQQDEILRLAKEHRGWSDTEAKQQVGTHYGHPGRLDLMTFDQAQEAIETLRRPRQQNGGHA